MESVKDHLLDLLATYNHGRPVSYPVLDRKMQRHFPELVKAGRLGPMLDELVAAKLIEQTGPSSYQVLHEAGPAVDI